MSKSTTACANLGVVLDSSGNCHISCEGVRVSEENIEIVLTCVLSCMRYRCWGVEVPPPTIPSVTVHIVADLITGKI